MTALPQPGSGQFLKSLQESISHYRSRADELRAYAEAHATRAARDTLLSVADSYEKMADRLERICAVLPTSTAQLVKD
jgi:hypothetical protein